jgi:hypothetical protein
MIDDCISAPGFSVLPGRPLWQGRADGTTNGGGLNLLCCSARLCQPLSVGSAAQSPPERERGVGECKKQQRHGMW